MQAEGNDTWFPEDDYARKPRQRAVLFDAATLDALATFVATFERPGLLCAPMLGRVLHERGLKPRVLDVDERFAGTRRAAPLSNEP